jgi:hypothetical protein
MVGGIRLPVTRTTSRYFVETIRVHFDWWIELLSRVKSRGTAYRATEPVDAGMVYVLHRLRVWTYREYGI